jgi:TetR/AcrR family transcriptional regulator, acrAB operon repressor
MAKRSKEEALETRERILDAAIVVFHEHGVARPSLTEVAELAGVTRGAIYGHFENKADLFSALCERVRLPTEIVSDADAAACQANPLGKLREIWLFLFHKAAADRDWQRIFDIIIHRCEMVEESGLIQQRLYEAHREGLARMSELLRQAVLKGQLPADLDIDAAMPLLHGSLIGVLSEWLFRPEAFELAAAAERYVDSLLWMLQTAPMLRQPAGSDSLS